MVSCSAHKQCLCVALTDLVWKVWLTYGHFCIYCRRLPPIHSYGRLFRARTVLSTVPLHPAASLFHDKDQDRQTSSADILDFHQIKMVHTIFEHLLSCRNCNSPILVIEDPSASRSTVATVAGSRVGLVIRHGTRESAGSVSSLQFFPFKAAEPLPHWGTEESSTSRHVIYMEDCTTPAYRRQISQEWGLRWLNFEQHFETIAAFSQSQEVGECPCKCHLDSSADECVSIDTTLALVGQQSGRPFEGSKGPETEHSTHHPTDLPSELRGRARSEEIPPIDVFILSWREQCRRASH